MLILSKRNVRSVLDDQAIETIRKTLRENGGNVRQAGFTLRVPYRTLTQRITRLGLRPELARIRKRSQAAA